MGLVAGKDDPRDYSGLRLLRRTRRGTNVGLYHSLESGIESDPELPWTTVCEDHGQLVCHRTYKLALHHLSDPEGWCEGCRKKERGETV